MKVLVVGGGPAGLCFAAALKRSTPNASIRILERRPVDESRGWGITLPAATLREMREPVEIDHHRIEFAEMRFQGRSFLRTPLEFCTLARDALVAKLRDRCTALGLTVEHDCDVGRTVRIDPASYDVVVGADGVNSWVCETGRGGFLPNVTHSDIRYVWLATTKRFGPGLPSIFRESDGELFLAWPTNTTRSSAPSSSSARRRRSRRPASRASARTRRVSTSRASSSRSSGGHPIPVHRELSFLQFPFVKCRRWVHGNLVLVGDAAHTAHYSKGYGTELALHDALALARALSTRANVRDALAAYERERQPQVARYQARAMSTHNWYARVLTEYATKGPNAVEDAIREVEAASQQHAT